MYLFISTHVIYSIKDNASQYFLIENFSFCLSGYYGFVKVLAESAQS